MLGDWVSLNKYIGRFDLNIAGKVHSVHFNPGQIGIVEQVIDAETVVLLMAAQNWEEEYAQCEYVTTALPAFSTMFGIEVNKLKISEIRTVWSGTSSNQSYHDVKKIKVKFIFDEYLYLDRNIYGGKAVLYEDLGNNGLFQPLSNKMEWRQRGISIRIGMYSKVNEDDLIWEFKGTIDGDRITGTQAQCGGDGKCDWVLERE